MATGHAFAGAAEDDKRDPELKASTESVRRNRRSVEKLWK
jgi:hypothetical protein